MCIGMKFTNVNAADHYTAFSAAVDFAFALVPWFLVKNLNMKRAEKLGVAIAMSFGTM